jgi:predicted ATPase/DNA-binding SARP family transcriptional activator
MAQLCRIEMFGGLRVRQDARVITRFRTQKAAALLAYLAYYHHQSHPREVLIALLWPDMEPDAGRNNLSTILSSLRHQLEPPGTPAGAVIVADRLTLGLNAEAITTDVADFEARLQMAEATPSETERAQHLADALELYAGALLPGCYEDWIAAENQRLTDAYLQAVRRLIRYLVRTKEMARALDYARRAVLADPLREEAHRDLMRLYVAAGLASAALQQYRELERVLREELGATPSATTRQLIREIQSREVNVSLPTPQPEPETPSIARQPATTRGQTPLQKPSITSPSGTVTFLLTDIEDTRALREGDADTRKAARAHFHALLRCERERAGGYLFRQTEDAALAAFQSSGDALACAVAAQRTLFLAEGSGESGALRARMALHTGDVVPRDGSYESQALDFAARMLTAGYGGQVLCSEATASLLRRNLEIGTRLQDLGVYRLREDAPAEHLFQIAVPGLPSEFSPLKAEAGHAGSLPLQFTRFFGREAELSRLQALLRLPETRLVTLTGPGGTGKTRLAIETAARLAEAFSGAVWFVPLADLSDARLIPTALIEALRLLPSGSLDPLEQAVEALARQPALLALDNFEQLVEEGARLVRTLLERVPTLTLLLTSRQRLELTGEHEFFVTPLPTPYDEGTPEQVRLYESVQLFIDRAQAVKPDFQVTAGNAGAIARLCAGLEGIPLALELAAARAQVLTPAQMLAQLEHRFDFLVSRRRDAEARHRTLRSAMDWSYRLLPPELQRFCAQLSVFRGGWSAEAAEAVCEEPLALDYLAMLRECSLVLVEESDSGVAEMRFRMLETIREYGQERLREREAEEPIQAHHRDFFLQLAEEAEPHLRGPEQLDWLARLDTEHDNLRAALAGCLQSQESAVIGLRIAGALWKFWHVRGYLSEGRQWLQRTLRQTEGSGQTAGRAKGLAGLGLMAVYQGDYETAHASHEESLAIRRALDDKAGVASSLNNLGLVATARGDYAAAQQFHSESLTLRQELGDRAGAASSLHNLGLLAHFAHDLEQARALYTQALEIDRESEDRWAIAYSLNSLGEVTLAQGDYVTAQAHFAESLALRRELEDKRGLGGTLSTLGGLHFLQGELEVACSYLQEGIALLRELGDRRELASALHRYACVALAQKDFALTHAVLMESLEIRRYLGYAQGIVDTLQGFADLAAAAGHPARAARLWGATEALRETLNYPIWPLEIPNYERIVSAARTCIGATAFDQAFSAGRALPIEQAIQYALEEADASRSL